jgi:hypothetical protein
VRVSFSYDDGSLHDISNDHPDLLPEDYFDGFRASVRCTACVSEYTVSEIDTK